MSLKKDRFNSFDKKYMRFAINLAKNQNGLTGTNPSVGCVIVKNKKIVSYGATNLFNFRALFALWKNTSLYKINH